MQHTEVNFATIVSSFEPSQEITADGPTALLTPGRHFISADPTMSIAERRAAEWMRQQEELARAKNQSELLT